MARKRGITRSRSFTAGARAYANSAANVSKSKVWITCPASHRISSATPVQARMANGRPTRRIHVAITTTELTSRVARGRVFEYIHLLLCHGYCCVFHDRSCSHVGTHKEEYSLKSNTTTNKLDVPGFSREVFLQRYERFLHGPYRKKQGHQIGAPASYDKVRHLAHTAGHLQLDQAVQLNRVLHREFLGDRLDEAVDDQRVGLGLIQATAHQVEELVVTDLRDGRFVADFGLVLFDANGWIGIGASMLIEQECVTADMR